ncbi:unnamed protein product [Somion occarium]|uniref:Urea carboxylase n=1 Tax=Somion occarium TaxID=3059160 RepID=A0ABP1CJS1_9APHY
MAYSPSLERHKLLVLNRGEIAVRILRTTKRLGLRSVAVYTQVDATSPHVSLADEAVLIHSKSSLDNNSPPESNQTSDAKAYLAADAIVKICVDRNVTLVHPGYGFLSENAGFARLLDRHGITLLGPRAQTIEDMGLKHLARDLAIQAGVPVVPGSNGLVEGLHDAQEVAKKVGFPVMLKATAGGGGIGLVFCGTENDLRTTFDATIQRAKSLFHNEGVFIEKFFHTSRHIEVQIFGNGCNHVIHMGERECSVQRRHQKIIEEAPSPYLVSRQDLRSKICAAAVRLGELVNYKSAGTVEFLVDDATGEFYFLEMNTRLQVEHGVTEMLHPGLDLVELMILQGIYEGEAESSPEFPRGLPSSQLDQKKFEVPRPNSHAIEVRVYSENPANKFSPSPGILQYVKFPETNENLRIDTWVSTGMVVTPFYDPLIAKIIVKNTSRAEAIKQLSSNLHSRQPVSTSGHQILIQGPPNNIPFLAQVLKESLFISGKATTKWIDEGAVQYTPDAMTVLSPGIHTTVQSLPNRDIGLGIPPSGPMDPLAFQVANLLVKNSVQCEGLELVIPPKNAGRSSGLLFSALFHVRAVVAVTGANAIVQIDGQIVPTWTRLVVGPGAKLVIGCMHSDGSTSGGGLRAYLAIGGGFPGIPSYLGSKSTSMGGGGYQGRALQGGDMLQIMPFNDDGNESLPLPRSLIPSYPPNWILYSLPGPQDDTEFITEAGIEAFYTARWRVSISSNRMGIRLEPVNQDASDTPVLQWARSNGGEGGSHPSNILDNGYARGTVNLNGDTPVILTNEGPSMGGYLCISTIASADQWKLGQLRPGDHLRFARITYQDAMNLQERVDRWLKTILAALSRSNVVPFNLMDVIPSNHTSHEPKLHVIPATSLKPKAGDSAVLVEYGEMTLDFSVRARIHALETSARQFKINGIKEFAPCIRSTMVHFDPVQINQGEVLTMLIRAEETLPDSIEDMQFPGRRLTFPIALDDRWNRDTLQRYMSSTRDKAVYLPSNIEYLAANNGIEGGTKDALQSLVSSSWLVFGVGFYLACPFLVPIDPRCRLVGQKMNPSRTYTPRGAVGIAGLVAAIYPVESPGGYQLFGRTLPAWQPWGKGPDFAVDRPWLLDPFDQVVFEPVSEDDYVEVEKLFDSGRYAFKIEPVVLSMKDYLGFISGIEGEIDAFKRRQAEAVALQEARENILLKEWQESTHRHDDPDDRIRDLSEETPYFMTASLSGTVWKIRVAIGDIVMSSDEALVILEAMKTEINLTAGEDHIGLKVAGFAKGVREGTTVQAGDKLIFFAEP